MRKEGRRKARRREDGSKNKGCRKEGSKERMRM